MNEQYFFVRKLDLGKEVASLSQPSGNGGISSRWNEMHAQRRRARPSDQTGLLHGARV